MVKRSRARTRYWIGLLASVVALVLVVALRPANPGTPATSLASPLSIHSGPYYDIPSGNQLNITLNVYATNTLNIPLHLFGYQEEVSSVANLTLGPVSNTVGFNRTLDPQQTVSIHATMLVSKNYAPGIASLVIYTEYGPVVAMNAVPFTG